jgi:integrase
MRPLAPEQVGVLFGAARGDRLEALYVLAVTTGSRQGELLGREWEDVDRDGGTLRVRRALTTAKGGPLPAAPKNKDSRRSVKLPTEILRSPSGPPGAQLREIDAAGPHRRENGLMFASEAGEPLDPPLRDHAPVQTSSRSGRPPPGKVSRPQAHVRDAPPL